MLQDDNSKSNGRNNNEAPFIAQVNDTNGLPITYFWYHSIASNLIHNIKSCKHQRESHKLNATCQNQIGGSTECCKIRNKLIGRITAGSKNNTVKEIKLPLL